MKEKLFIYECLDAIFSDPRLSAMERNVLLALARFSDKSGSSYPSRKTLAEYLRYRPEWISRTTRSLMEKQWVSKGRSQYGTVLYHLHPECSTSEQCSTSAPCTPDAPRYTTSAPDNAAPVHTDEESADQEDTLEGAVPVHGGGAVPVHEGGAVRGCSTSAHKEPYRRTSEEPEEEPEEKGKTGEPQIPMTPDHPNYDPAFDEEIDFGDHETAEQKLERERREAEQEDQEYWERLPDFFKKERPMLDVAKEPPFSLDQYPGWKVIWGTDKAGVSTACSTIQQALKTWYPGSVQRAIAAAAAKYPRPDDYRSYLYGVLKRELKRGQVAL